jgi:membrane-bound serine protease (ClpP class)
MYNDCDIPSSPTAANRSEWRAFWQYPSQPGIHWRENMEEILLNPNLVYLFIVGGFSLAFMAILTPGTGILEILGLFLFLLAGWGVFNLPINYWALGLLIVGVFPPIIGLRRTQKKYFLLISVLSLVIGSAFLLKGEKWYQLLISPGLAIVVSILIGSFFWVVTQKVLEADLAPPSHDLSSLIGSVGEAKTFIHQEGSVQVNNELWTARSQTPIQSGSHIRVVDREGFILVVEEV